MTRFDGTRDLASVETVLQYSPNGETAIRASKNGASRRPRPGRHIVKIFDARPIRERLSLDQEGFRLVRSKSAVQDFYDPSVVRKIYYREMESLVCRLTGAAKAVTFAHDVRNRARSGENGIREPVDAVHNDYTPKSGPQMVRQTLPRSESEELLQKRFAEFNLWRAVRGPVISTPLAVCDAHSVKPRDLVTTILKHEVYLLRYRANHRWFYFPRMRTDEVLAIKCFDSAEDGRARFTPHSAFEDPSAPPDAPPRESIEVRVLAFFDRA